MDFKSIIGAVCACLAVISLNTSASTTINVFFAGGQSNAKQPWADSIGKTLSASGAYSNVLIVNSMHPGDWLYEWYYQDAPNYNYDADFYNIGGTGVLESSFNEIELAGDTFVFTGLFWFQGEGDTGAQSAIDLYESRFLGMLDQLYSDVNGEQNGSIDFTMAVIDANPIYEQPAGRTWDQINSLRDAQFNLASSYGSYVDTRGYDRLDEWHLTTSALELLGTEMANTFLSTYIDTDGDLVVDSADAFPNNDAASVDDDSDDLPDAWNTSCDATCQNNSGLTLDIFLDDTDNDGVTNGSDAFPYDPAETIDTDNDGVGDNSDNCPVNANADQLNTDADNAGNVCDTDDDNDGVLDTEDDFPLDPEKSTRSSGGGSLSLFSFMILMLWRVTMRLSVSFSNGRI